MITASSLMNTRLSSPVRTLIAEVELYKGSTLVQTFKHSDRLVRFTIERVGEENKFFGVGICQHIKVDILDKNRTINFIDTSYSLKVKMGVSGELVYPFPTFYVTQTRRDENTNALSIYGYDVIKKASIEKVGSIAAATRSVQDFANKCASAIGTTMITLGIGASETCFSTSLPTGVNFDGSETVREGFNDIAEVTQTIYYADNQDRIVFRRLQKSGADFTIDKSKYFTLETKDTKRLAKIQHNTSLGDNVFAETSLTGTTQFVRDNCIWSYVTNLGTLLQNAINAYGGITIAQFECYWRGNFLVEIGDRIALTTKDNQTIYSFMLDDVLEYDGTFMQKTKWSYNDDTNEEEGGNPATLGEIISQTYAKVDKAAGQIELVVKKTDELEDKVSSIVLDADAITSTVQRVEKMEGDMEVFESKIEQTADALDLTVKKGEIISAINLSPENIVISSGKIDLSGCVTFTDLDTPGATEIHGSNIITGTINADSIDLTGAITFGDLSAATQERIDYATEVAEDAYDLALAGGGDLPDYIKSTYIDGAEIRSPQIKGNNIKVYNTFQTVNASGTVSGYMGAAKGMDASGTTTYGVALSNEWSSNTYSVGENYVIVTNAGVRLQAGNNSIVVTDSSVHLNVEDGKAYYNNVEIGSGSGSSGTIVPVWG